MQQTEIWSLMERHATLVAEIEALKIIPKQEFEVRRLLIVRLLEEKALRETLIDLEPTSSEGAQAKVLYFAMVSAKTGVPLDEASTARLMTSVTRFL